jgi:hypothetical protein
MLGGTSTDAEDKPVVLDEVVVFDMEDTNTLVCSINPVVTGPRPAARTGATMLEYAPGQLLLYGGVGADGKPLNDAYVLDVDALAWQRVYSGSPDLVGPQGEDGCSSCAGLLKLCSALCWHSDMCSFIATVL